MADRLRRTIGCLALLILLAGCGALVAPEKEFSSVARDYTMRLRWMDFSGAARHFDPSLREAFLQELGGNDDLQVVDVSLESLDFSQESRRARTIISLEYYILPSATVQRYLLDQQWEYGDSGRYGSGVWQIVSPFPPFP